MAPHSEAVKYLEKVFIQNLYRNIKGGLKGSDVANLPPLMVVGQLQHGVSPSWLSALE